MLSDYDYDYYVTVGRAEREAAAWRAGYVTGLLSDYLVDSSALNDFWHYDDDTLVTVSLDAYEYGRHDRAYRTAEELYVWAWGLELGWLDIYEDDL